MEAECSFHAIFVSFFLLSDVQQPQRLQGCLPQVAFCDVGLHGFFDSAGLVEDREVGVDAVVVDGDGTGEGAAAEGDGGGLGILPLCALGDADRGFAHGRLLVHAAFARDEDVSRLERVVNVQEV